MPMALKRLLPYGVKDYYPPEATLLNFLFKSVEKEVNLWGYKEIVLPTLEFEELFNKTLGDIEDGFTAWGNVSEKRLMLRYDFTPQIVRYVLHRRGEEFPLRIYYRGKTFKTEGELWERFRVGFELLGADRLEADAEIVSLTVKILNRLGVENYTILIGHRQMWDLLVEKFGGETLKELNALKLDGKYLKNRSLESLGELKEEFKEAVENLISLGELLRTHGVNTDRLLFSSVLEPHREYYCGVFFKVLDPRGKVLAKGGRYDKLFETFGESVPATGAALSVENLLEHLTIPKGRNTFGVYIIDTTPERQSGWRLANLLRQRGIPAERDIVSRDVARSLQVAVSKGYKTAVVISAGKNADISKPEGLEVLFTKPLKSEEDFKTVLERLKV